jgi:hypothetical protein
MLNASDFRLFHIQAVIYTPPLDFRASKALAFLLGNYSQQFNATPLSLPVPWEAPPEIPRLALRGEDGRLQLQAGPARLDIIREQEAIPLEMVGEFMEFAAILFDAYLREMAGQANRLACLFYCFAENPNGAAEAAQHFCKPELLRDPLNRPSDFQLHAAKQFEFGGWVKVNSWFRCKSANLKFGDAPAKSGVMVEQDFNMPEAEPSAARVFGPDEIRKFCMSAPEEFQTVLSRYFPAEAQNHG